MTTPIRKRVIIKAGNADKDRALITAMRLGAAAKRHLVAGRTAVAVNLLEPLCNGSFLVNNYSSDDEIDFNMDVFEVCPVCEWIKTMNPEGEGWCSMHGDKDAD